MEDLVLEEDFLDHLVRAADEARTTERGRSIELGARSRRPAALAPDARHRLGERREGFVRRLLLGVGDVAMRVDPDFQRRRVMTGAARGLAIKIDQRREARRLAAMMASASGRPSVPARTTDSGVPPTAIQTGSGFWIGRG